MRTKKGLLLILLAAVFPLTVHAQGMKDVLTLQQERLGITAGQTMPLDQKLRQLEEAYDARIFYMSESVQGKYVSKKELPAKGLEARLTQLLDPLQMTYRKLTESSFVVFEREEPAFEKVVLETVTGTVTDAGSEEPLPGVNVIVKGTTTGTSTNADGEYELTVESLQDTLVFSFIGYQTRQVPINGRSTVNVQLQSQAITGEELVVVGYGTQQKRHLTGSVGNIQMEEVASRPVVDFGQAMYGKIADVEVQNMSGRPGESTRIQVRGVGSITAGSQPLIVVDGVALPNFDLNTLNASDIESIDILKDASSAAIYGSRGSGGVILVTTKSGSPEESKVSFNYSFTNQRVIDKIDAMNSVEYAQASIDAAQIGWIRSGGDPNAPNTIEARGARKYTWPVALENPETLPDVDYQDVMFRDAPMHQANISLSGGDDNSIYYVSFGLVNQDGIIIESDFQKYTLNLKAETTMKDWLTVGGSLNSNLNEENLVGNIGHNRRPAQYPPIYPVFSEDGYLGGPHNQPGFEPWNAVLFRAVNGHPLYRIGEKDDRRGINLTGSAFVEMDVLPQLSFKSTFNTFYSRSDRERYRDMDTNLAPGVFRQARFSGSMNRTLNYISENLVMYNENWKDHEFDIVAGFEFNKREFYSMNGQRRDYNNDLIPFLSAGNTVFDASDGANENSLISLFGRLNYNYQGKYMGSVSFRRDGSSRFGPDNKWGNFPAISVGWRISDETFMESLDFLNNLTVRTSFGFTGNNNIGNYTWISTMSQNRVAIGNSLQTTFHPTSVQNPELKWERTRQLNFGINIGLFDDRIFLESDFYRSESEDLILNVPVPSTSGFTSQITNIGAVRNTGMELGITSHNMRTTDFSWTSKITFSRNRGEVIRLGPDDAPVLFRTNNMDVINQVGDTPFSFFAYDYLGAYRNQAEIDAHGVEYPFDVHPGMGKYRDVDGDGRITSDDRTLVGNPEPDFIWGLSNQFGYRNFDFSFVIHGKVGGEVYDANWRRSMFYHEGRNYLSRANDRWRSEEEPGDGYIHALSVDVAGTLEREASSYWIMDGSYTRLKDITIGYNIPASHSQRLGITGMRLYINATNLLSFQSTTTIDPENSDGGPTSATTASQHSTYPTAKTVSVGINLDF